MGGDIRLVELDRRGPSFVQFKNAVRSKYKVNSDANFAFQLPSGTKIAVRSDEDLKRAISESANTKQHYVEIDASGAGYRPTGNAGSSAASQPQSRPQQQTYSAPASQPTSRPAQTSAQPRSNAPSAPSGGSGSAVISFNIRGSGTAEKVKIQAQQEASYYRFIPAPAQDDALIEVELPTARQLTFKISTSKARLTQTFNMPFDVSPKDLVLQGSEVILTFPF